MEHHSNIVADQAKGDWISQLSLYPEIQNEWITNLIRTNASLNRQIEALQSLLAALVEAQRSLPAAKEYAESIDEDYNHTFLASMRELEHRKNVIKSQIKKSRKRAQIQDLDPQSLAQTPSSCNKTTTTNLLNKEVHFHAKER